MMTDQNRLLYRILIAISLGIATGLFLGDYVSVLKPVGDIYIMLLQSIVYPYLIASLVGGFGRMDATQTARFLRHGWFFYLLLVGSVFFVLFVLISGIPKAQSHIIPVGGNPSVWSEMQDSLHLFIPANPFSALVNNAIPAIVLFSILYGLALQRYEKKESILVCFEALSRASLKIWDWVIKVAPIGIFALIAFASGTISTADVEGLSVYAFLYFFGALFITFVLLPLILQTFVPVSVYEFLGGMQSGFLIAMTTTLSVAALPFIEGMVRSLLKKNSIDAPEGKEILDNTLAISYPICQMGNCFAFLFMVAIGAYFHQSLTSTETITLSLFTFLSSIGSPTATVNSIQFMLNLIHFPESGLDLYVLLLPLTRYPQVLVSVVSMAFLTTAVSFAYFHKLTFNIRAFCGTIIAAFALLIAGLILGPSIQAITPDVSPNLLAFQLSQKVMDDVKISFSTPTPSSQSEPYSLAEIKERGVLRVGYNDNMIPWCYRNNKNELVGYDVAFMVQLAKDMNVALEFIPFEWPTLVDAMEQNQFDIAIGSIYVTSDRLQEVSFSQSYDSAVSSLIVRNKFASHFDRLDDILKMKHLRIGVFDNPVTYHIAELNFPEQDLVKVQDYNEHVFDDPEINAILWTKGHTDAWVSAYKGYTSISPEGLIEGWPQMYAYMLNKQNSSLQSFLNDWLNLKKTEGFTQIQEDKWIHRSLPKTKTPRWSIINNVL
jgi:proton glutamate symport protein